MGRPARIALGRVVGAHGLRGQLRVRYFADTPGNLARLKEVALGADPDDPQAELFEVERAEPGRRGEVRMTLAGVTGREAAEELRGLLVCGDPAGFEPLEAGEYYWFQLLGCRVAACDGRRVGTVREIWDTGAQDVLVVEDPEGREILIPVAAALLREVDVEQGRIVVEEIPGLLDPA